MAIKHQFYNIYRESNKEMDWDAITRFFLKMMASDPELDYTLCRLGPLFVGEVPKTFGEYEHHGRDETAARPALGQR